MSHITCVVSRDSQMSPQVMAADTGPGFGAQVSLSSEGYCVTAVFPPGNRSDRCVEEVGDHLVVFDGVLFNDEDLMARYGGRSIAEMLTLIYKAEGDTFCREFRGEFSGMLFDRRRKAWIFYTSQAGSKPLFYWQNDGYLVVSSSLLSLRAAVNSIGGCCTPDVIGCYMMLTYGFMLEDATVLSGVRKLQAGRYLIATDHRTVVKEYYRLENRAASPGTNGEVVEGIDHYFRAAVQLAFEKDSRNSRKSLVSLSAGLDSRMVAYVSADLGFDRVTHVNYAQSGSADEWIPRLMAADLGRELVFYPLDRGDYLTRTIHDMYAANGGMIYYAGASHTMSICRLLDFSGFGTFHSGMIGDAVLGSFLHGARQCPPASGQGAISMRLLSRIQGPEEEALRKYESEEMFRFYNRAFNGAHGGTLVANQFTDMSSPFLNPEFMDFVLGLPPAVRYGENLYIDWVCRCYPRAARQPWGATGMSVRASRRIHWPLSKVQAALGRVRPKRRMNPIEYWYATNPRLRTYCQSFFDANIELLQGEPELQADCRWLFETGNFSEKAQVMTVLELWNRCFSSDPTASRSGPTPATPAAIGGRSMVTGAVDTGEVPG